MRLKHRSGEDAFPLPGLITGFALDETNPPAGRPGLPPISMHLLLPRLFLLPILASAADAALTITIAPDGAGGTTYSFSQPALIPPLPVAQVLSSSFRLELPPGMFDPEVVGGPGSSETSGTFDLIARFQDVRSGFIYDVTGLRIAADLSSASFEFDRAFLQAPGQTFSQFLLTPGPPGVLPIAPEALVEGSHSIGSLLFGTVTVNVVPEPSSFSLVLLGSVALMRRRRTA